MLKYLISTLLLLTALMAHASPPAGYYSSVNASSAAQLRATLHPVIDDHKRYPYSSSRTDTWDILDKADEDADNSRNVTTIYKNASYRKAGRGNNNYNREHSWPKSYGFPRDGSSNYPYTDAHHLFVADSRYNSSRSNKYFDNCNSSCEAYRTVRNDGAGGVSAGFPGDSSWSDNDSWQVWNQRKGDIARAMFYMDIRYEGGTHNTTGYREPDLRLTDSVSLINRSKTGSNESIAYMGLLSVLLQWHQQDPVSDDERARNDVVASYQGNRNPFVDNPQWVACLYQNQCSGAGGGNNSSVLRNGETRTGLSGSGSSWKYFTITLPAGASGLSIKMAGGSGDADLYVKKGSRPTTSSYDCRPYTGGNNETCTISPSGAGTYYIGISAYSSYSSVTLKASYRTSGGGNVSPSSGSFTNVSSSRNGWKHYKITLPGSASNLQAEISANNGDADLYVRKASRPTTSSYDCRPYKSGSNETCNVRVSGTVYYISVRAYSAYRNLTVKYRYR